MVLAWIHPHVIKCGVKGICCYIPPDITRPAKGELLFAARKKKSGCKLPWACKSKSEVRLSITSIQLRSQSEAVSLAGQYPVCIARIRYEGRHTCCLSCSSCYLLPYREQQEKDLLSKISASFPLYLSSFMCWGGRPFSSFCILPSLPTLFKGIGGRDE